MRAGEGEERRVKEHMGMGVTISDTQSQRGGSPEHGPGPATGKSSAQLRAAPRPRQPCTRGCWLELRGEWDEGEKRRGVPPSCPIPAVKGRQGREGAEEPEAGGTLGSRGWPVEGEGTGNKSSPEDLFRISRTSRAWTPWDCSWPRICMGRYRLGQVQNKGAAQ